MGGLPAHFSDRGVNGALEDLLFPLTHGTLFYPGMEVLPTFAVHGANRLPDEQFAAACASYTARLEGLFTDAPIPFRAQNGGDYGLDLRLAEGVGAARGSLTLHRRDID
jgi:NAD(P)H dehydrogenase (quinone)